MIINTPFNFNIDFSFWSEIVNQPALSVVRDLFTIIGWPIFSILIFYVAAYFWEDYRSGKEKVKWQWVVLAIDVPDISIQTPKAVEQIFAHLSGAFEPPNIVDKYWKGKVQKYFSFEVVSIEGYIQFLIRTEEEYRDLVEAVIYAQYPEAEITEVEDYVNYVKEKYPDENYDMIGVDFKLENSSPYPIRTYPDFKYDVNPDIAFSDPMAALLENFTRIGKGENLWLQIIIEPTNSSWKEEGISIVKELVTGKKGSKTGALNKFGDIPRQIANDLVEHGWRTESMSGEVIEKREEIGKMSDLTPGKRTVIEAIEQKISKIGFKSKVRLLYSAPNNIFSPSRCIGGVIGAMNQFTIQNSNGLLPASVVKKPKKKNIFVQAYKKRKMKIGASSYILNIEELATLWHFPMPFVKAPMIQKIAAKKAEPPSDLPMDLEINPFKQVGITKKAQAPGGVPGDLPVENLPVDKNLPLEQDAPPENLPFG